MSCSKLHWCIGYRHLVFLVFCFKSFLVFFCVSWSLLVRTSKSLISNLSVFRSSVCQDVQCPVWITFHGMWVAHALCLNFNPFPSWLIHQLISPFCTKFISQTFGVAYFHSTPRCSTLLLAFGYCLSYPLFSGYILQFLVPVRQHTSISDLLFLGGRKLQFFIMSRNFFTSPRDTCAGPVLCFHLQGIFIFLVFS